jgi:hypothetical protein
MSRLLLLAVLPSCGCQLVWPDTGRQHSNRSCCRLSDAAGSPPAAQVALPDEPGAEAEPVYVEMAVQNTHRAVGTTLSHEVTKRFGQEVSSTLPRCAAPGSAQQRPIAR